MSMIVCQQGCGLRKGQGQGQLRRGQHRPARRTSLTKTKAASSDVNHAVRLTFRLKRHIEYGQSHKVVGSGKLFGNWDVQQAPVMQWRDGDVWELDLEVPAGEKLDFKCVQEGNGRVNWESGDNRSLLLQDDWASTVLNIDWDQTSKNDLQVLQQFTQQQQNGNSQSPSISIDSEEIGSSQDSDQELEEEEGGEDISMPKTEWVGKDIEFMSSNNHSKERQQSSWNLAAVQGWKEGEYVVAGDKKSANWLRKLEMTKELLVDQSEDARPNIDELVAAYIYLTWIGSGAIQCVEGGGHYRPNKHAELSRLIFRSLEWVIDDSCTGNFSSVSYRKNKRNLLENASQRCQVARMLQTKIPSFDAQFTASTPLTRIRDIAHRSDIPRDLKNQIKHTIQNKLHRNAGPEDLQATEILLAQLLKNKDDYSQEFIEEFKLFTNELRDFFNAGSLVQLLESLRPSIEDDPDTQQLLEAFLDRNSQLKLSESTLNDLMEVLHRLTTVRAILVSKLAPGLRNDASDLALAMRQKFRLAEIRCQDYAFVLMSQIVNLLNQDNLEKKGVDPTWGLPIGALVLGVRQLGLSGWEVDECMAIENELETWQAQGSITIDRECGLRMKATLLRLKRLQDKWSEMNLELFAETSRKLGQGLGLDQDIYNVFSESEIRAHVIFQIAKINSMLSKAINVITDSSPWDSIVLGEASGKLVMVEKLDPDALPQNEANVIALVKEADGDEEISALGDNLKGVLLCHSLPNLSHLGVRARQERVPFACCEDQETIQQFVQPFLGQNVSINVDVSGLVLSEGSSQLPSETSTEVKDQDGQKMTIQRPQFSDTGLIAGADATQDSCGAKAASVAQLAQMGKEGGFQTMQFAVIPFGSMEDAVKQAGKQDEWKSLLSSAETATNSEADEVARQLRDLVSSLSLDSKFINALKKTFDSTTRLIARSSSNVEDLEGLSGAGLYDSIGGLYLKNYDDFSSAVAQVWASLYTRRAILSRRAAGVPQTNASMAVLVQEMVDPQLSFVLHTQDPENLENVAMELAPGLGETLASGTRGSGYRMSVNDSDQDVQMMSFANFSTAYINGGESTRVVDYSKEQFSIDQKYRQKIGIQLCQIGKFLESKCGMPQDVEGAIMDGSVYVFQTRPQPL